MVICCLWLVGNLELKIVFSFNVLCILDVVVWFKIGFRMELVLKCFKMDDDFKENGIFDEKFVIFREFLYNGEKCSDKFKMEREFVFYVGNE